MEVPQSPYVGTYPPPEPPVWTGDKNMKSHFSPSTFAPSMPLPGTRLSASSRPDCRGQEPFSSTACPSPDPPPSPNPVGGLPPPGVHQRRRSPSCSAPSMCHSACSPPVSASAASPCNSLSGVSASHAQDCCLPPSVTWIQRLPTAAPPPFQNFGSPGFGSSGFGSPGPPREPPWWFGGDDGYDGGGGDEALRTLQLGLQAETSSVLWRYHLVHAMCRGLENSKGDVYGSPQILSNPAAGPGGGRWGEERLNGSAFLSSRLDSPPHSRQSRQRETCIGRLQSKPPHKGSFSAFPVSASSPKASPGLHRDGTEFYSQTTFDASQSSVQALRRGEDHHRRIAETRPSLHVSATARAPSVPLSYSPIPATCDRAATRRPLPPGPYAEAVGLTAQRFGRENGGAGVASLTQVGASIATVPALSEIPSASSFSACASCTGPPCRGEVRAGSAGGRGEDSVSWEESSSLKKAERVAEAEGSLSFFTTRAPTTPVAGKYSMPTSRGSNASLDAGREKGRQRDGDDNRGREKEKAREEKGEVNPRLELQWLDGDNVRWFNEELARKLRQYREKQLHAAANKIQDAWRNSARRQRERENELAVIADKLRKLKGEADGRASGKGQETCSGHRDRRKSHNERESETSSERERGREKLVRREREIEKLSRSESERGMRSRRKREGEKLRRHREREASTEWGEERENSKKREKERKKQLRSESEMDTLSRREREGGQLRRRGRERKEVGERREEKDLETEERSRKTRRERGREGEERRRILSPERAARTIEAAFRGFRVRRTVAHVTEEGRRRMPQQRGGDAEGNLEAFSFSQLKHLDELTQTLLPLELKVLAEASFRQPSGMDGRNGGRRGDKEEREGPSRRRLARGAARDRRRELRAQAILAAEVSTLTARALELRTQAEQHRGFRLPSPAASERQEREGRRPTSTAYARANFGKGEETKRERGKDSSSVPFSGSSSSPISSPFSRPPSLCSEGGEPRGARRRESREKHNMRDRQGGKRRRHATGTPESHRRRGDEESDESEVKKEKKKDKKKDERDKKRDKKEEHTKEQVRRGLVDLVVEARAQMREEKKRAGRVEDEEESEDIKKNFRRRGMRDSSDSYEGKKRRCHSRSRRRSACRRQVYGKSEETEEVQRRGRHLRRREDQEEESRAPWGQGRVTGYPQAWMDRSISEGTIAGGGVYFPPAVWRPSSSHEPPAFAFHPLITLPSYLPRSPYAEPIPICANRQTHNVTLSLSSASPSFSSTSSPRSLVSFVSSKSTFTREERRTREVDIEDLDEASEGSEPLGGPPAAATIRAAAAAVRHLGPFSGSIAVDAPESPEERRWSSFSPVARNVSLQTRPEKLQGEEHTKACLEAETTQGTADESVLGAAERARQEKVMLEKEREEAETRVKQLKKHLGEELARQEEESRRRSLLRMSASPWRLSRKSSLASLSPSRCVSLDVAEKRHPDTADQKELVERRVLGEADRFTDTDRKTGGAAGTQEVSMGLPSSSLECEAQAKEEEWRRREAARLLAEERVKAATGQAQLTLGEREEERRTKSLEDRRRRTLLSASVSPRADTGLVQIRITKAPSRVNGVSAHPCARPPHPHSPTSASFIPPSACSLASTSQSSVRPRLFSGSPAASVRDKDEAHTRGITEDASLMKLDEKADRKKEGYEASAVPAPTQAPPSSLGPNEKKGEEEEQNLQARPEIGSSPSMLSANVSHVESEGLENGAISVTGKSRQQPVHAANLRLPVLPPSVMRPRRTSGSGTPESRSVSPPQAAVRGLPQGQDASKKERNEGDRDQHQGGKQLEGGKTTEGQHSASDKEIFFTPSPSPEGVLSPSSPSLLTPFPTREHAGKPPLSIALSSTPSSSIFASSVPWSAAGQAGDQGRGAAGAGEVEIEDRGPNEELEGKKYTKTEEEPNGDKQGPSEGGRTSSQTETSRVTRPLPFLSVQDEGGREKRGRLLSTSKERRSHSRPASSPLTPLASPRPLSSQAVKGLRAKPRGAPSSAHSQEEGVENMAHADSVSSLDGSGEGNEKRASEKRRKNEQADTFEGSTTPVREEKVLEKSESREVRIEEAKADKASESGKPENTGASSGASNATVSSPLASPWTQSPSPVASPSHHACTGGSPPVDSASQASPSIFGTFSLRREAVSETGAKPTRIKRSQATPRSPLVSPRPLSSLREVRAKTPAALTPSTDGTMQREAPKQSDELVEQRGKPMGAEGWQPTQDDEGNKETEERLKQQEEERTTTKAEEERKMQEEEERKKKKEEEERKKQEEEERKKKKEEEERKKKMEEEERKKQEEEERKKKKEEEERKKKKEEEERKKQEEEERKKKKEEEERKKKKEEEERKKKKEEEERQKKKEEEERKKKKEEEERKKQEEEERKKKKEEEERKKKKEEEERKKQEEEERKKKKEEEERKKKKEEEERKKQEEEERKKKKEEEERKKKKEEEERQKKKEEEERQKKKEEEERKKKQEEEERKKMKEEEERKKKKEEEERKKKKEEEERTEKEEEERKKQEEEERKKKEEEARKKQEGGKRQTDEEHGEKKAESSIGFDSGSRGEKSRAATNRIGSEESPKEARKEESSRCIVHKDRDGAIKKGEQISKEGELIDLKEHLQTHEEHGPRKEDLDHRAVRRKLRDHQQAQEQQALLQQQARSESLLRRLRAAVKIQRAWRRHRKRVFRKKTQEKKALSADALRKQEEKRLEDERKERERRHQDLRQRMALLAEARRREEEGEAGERRLSDEEGEDVFSAGRKPEILEEEARRSGIRIFEPIVQEGGGVSQRTVTLYDRSTGTNEIAKRRQARAAEPRPQLRADPQASRRVDKECVSIQSDGRSRDDDARSVHAISRKASRREKRGSVTSEEGEQGGGSRLQEISDSPREEGASSAGESTDELPRIVLHMPSRRLSSSSENISSGDEAASQDVSDDEGREGLRRSAAQPRPEQEDDIRRRIRRMLREALDEKMRKSADSGVLIGDGSGVVSHMKRHSDAFGGSPHLYAVPRDIVSEACRDIHPEPAGRLRIGSERRFLEDGDARERGDRDKGRDSPKAPTTASPRSPRIPSADSLARHTYFFQQRRPSVEGPVEEVGRGWSTTQEASSSRGSSTAVPFDPAPVTSSREVISPASAAYSSSISWSRNCVAPRGSVSSHTTLQQREAKNRSKMSWLAPPSDSPSDETDSEEGFVFVEKQPAYRETVTGSSLALATRAEPREAAPQPGSQATPRLAPSRSAVPSLEDRRDERLPPERHSFVGFKEQESRRGLTEKETFSEQTRTDTPLGETGKNESGPPRSGVQDPIKTVGEIFHGLHDRDRDCLLGQLGYPSQASGLFAHTDKPDHVAPVVKPPRCRPSSECPSEPNSVPLLSPREERLEGSPRRLSDPRIPALLLPEDVVIGPTGHRRSDFTRRLSEDNKREADAGT